jgi:hypothetical protein
LAGNLQTQLAADIAALQKWAGVGGAALWLTWNGEEYRCMSSRLNIGSKLDFGGQYPDYSGRVVLAARDFQTKTGGEWVTGTIPKQGETVTVDGHDYKIDRVSYSPTIPTITLQLVAVHERPFRV